VLFIRVGLRNIGGQSNRQFAFRDGMLALRHSIGNRLLSTPVWRRNCHAIL
jgi:hypothetical protein